MGGLLQQKIDELFNGMRNVLTIADDIIISGFSELARDNDATLDKVLTNVDSPT